MPIYSFQSGRSGDDSDEDDLPLRKAGKKGKNHLLLSKKKAKKSSSNDDDGNPVANGAKKKLSMLFGRRRYISSCGDGKVKGKTAKAKSVTGT